MRLVYPMGKGAMRFLNVLGNKFFRLAFSWLLGQSIRDTLCGAKALSRRRYETIAANRAYFGKLDPFDDFDLIFGAARSSLKMVDLPIRYQERTYGKTNIRRWRHGLLLLRMVLLASRRIKLVWGSAQPKESFAVTTQPLLFLPPLHQLASPLPAQPAPALPTLQ